MSRCRESDGDDDNNSCNSISQQDIKVFVSHAASFVARVYFWALPPHNKRNRLMLLQPDAEDVLNTHMEMTSG